MVEDLSAFFSTSDFAVAATYNGAATVNGIFDRAYLEPLGNGVEGSAPVFTCAAADIPASTQGDTLVIASATYKVVGVEPDGTGIVVLRLEAQ
jgi:hypothetical protein